MPHMSPLGAASEGAREALILYGLGSMGQQIVDDLLAGGIAVELILDRGKSGQEYRGIPVLSLDDAGDGRLGGRSVLIGLHNHYVDVNRLHADLLAAGAARVLTPINLPDFIDNPDAGLGYWLEHDYDYPAHEADFARVRGLLADDKSRELFDSILRYRRTGDLADCPAPTLEDEYTPLDLPRFAGPLRLIGCGAYTGTAIHKFLKAGYAIDSFVAFEPDPTGFATLASRNFPVGKGYCLPLGSWSSTTQLRFAVGIPRGGYVSDDGNIVVQCVAIDDLLHGETINLVKLDVEGAEIETLKGMERLVREQRPNLVVSAYHTAGHLHEIVDLIESWQLGYRFHLRAHEYNTFGLVFYCLQDGLIEA